MEPLDGISILGFTFRVIHAEMVKGVLRRTLECPRCRLLIDERKAEAHVERHDRADNAKKRADEKRLLGFGAKPLPGQLGIPGVEKDVPRGG